MKKLKSKTSNNIDAPKVKIFTSMKSSRQVDLMKISLWCTADCQTSSLKITNRNRKTTNIIIIVVVVIEKVVNRLCKVAPSLLHLHQRHINNRPTIFSSRATLSVIITNNLTLCYSQQTLLSNKETLKLSLKRLKSSQLQTTLWCQKLGTIWMRTWLIIKWARRANSQRKLSNTTFWEVLRVDSLAKTSLSCRTLTRKPCDKVCLHCIQSDASLSSRAKLLLLL